MWQPRLLGRCASRCLVRNPITRSSTTSYSHTARRRLATETSIDTSSRSFEAIESARRPTSARAAISAGQVQTYKPRTPGVRHLRRPISLHLWRGKPFRALTFPKVGQGKGGRNRLGRVTVRHRGGGARRRIRVVDFFREEPGAHTVERIEYDPNRSGHLALLSNNATGVRSYIVAADNLRQGNVVHSYRDKTALDKLVQSIGGQLDLGMIAAKIAHPGNCLPIWLVPNGMQVHNVGSEAGGRAIFSRSAGTFATVIDKDPPVDDQPVGSFVTVKMQSGELRRVSSEACATVGTVSNAQWALRQLGKAGRSRWRNIRPSVRGVAMNAVDHPHGGGRGKSKGNKIPVSPWGTIAKSGYKTRKKSNVHKFLVSDRPRNHGKRRAEGPR